VVDQVYLLLLHFEAEDDCPDPDDGRGEGDEKWGRPNVEWTHFTGSGSLSMMMENAQAQ